MSTALWTRLESLIDAATDDDVRSHRLEVVAAGRRRATGNEVPADFLELERAAAMAAITAPRVLDRVASICPEPMVVLKGPEVAALYPDPGLRGFWDLDLLVADAVAVQRRLLAAGFTPIGNPELYEDLHHLRPLQAPGLLLALEVHSAPKWLEGRRAPGTSGLLEASSPAAATHPNLLRLPPEHHTLLLAVHSWAHEPLRRLRDLVDIALMAETADRRTVAALADDWRVARVWRTTEAVIEWLEGRAGTGSAQRVWAGNLSTARERTVLERHLERLTSDYWARDAWEASRRLPGRVQRAVKPWGSEPWSSKLRRSALAVRNARRPRSRHEEELNRRART